MVKYVKKKRTKKEINQDEVTEICSRSHAQIYARTKHRSISKDLKAIQTRYKNEPEFRVKVDKAVKEAEAKNKLCDVTIPEKITSDLTVQERTSLDVRITENTPSDPVRENHDDNETQRDPALNDTQPLVTQNYIKNGVFEFRKEVWDICSNSVFKRRICVTDWRLEVIENLKKFNNICCFAFKYHYVSLHHQEFRCFGKCLYSSCQVRFKVKLCTETLLGEVEFTGDIQHQLGQHKRRQVIGSERQQLRKIMRTKRTPDWVEHANRASFSVLRKIKWEANNPDKIVRPKNEALQNVTVNYESACMYLESKEMDKTESNTAAVILACVENPNFKFEVLKTVADYKRNEEDTRPRGESNNYQNTENNRPQPNPPNNNTNHLIYEMLTEIKKLREDMTEIKKEVCFLRTKFDAAVYQVRNVSVPEHSALDHSYADETTNRYDETNNHYDDTTDSYVIDEQDCGQPSFEGVAYQEDETTPPVGETHTISDHEEMTILVSYH